MDKVKLGARLEQLWLDAGYSSLGELYKKTGVSVATWSRIKYGEQFPSVETLKKLAEILPMSHCELLKLAGYITDDSCYRQDGGNAVLSLEEQHLIHKYRQLDARGQDVVHAVLDNQYMQAKKTSFMGKRII